MKLFKHVFLFGLLITQNELALDPEPNAVFVRIIDTGPGHAAVVQMPGNH